jgi:hypothetical protein
VGMFALGLLVGAVPCLAVPHAPCHQLCHPHPIVSCLAVTPAWWLSLGSSPALVFALDWWSLHIAAVMGDGVSVVVHSVLLGVGHYLVLLVERSLVLVKLKEKITHEWDQGGDTS